ncbi:hypothetical protein [Streptomyces misionensis]|uniref:hypothetical protein n=1 Tax=Streptomyces misionensis TaxID=67331 RepID=UPI003F4D1F6B
MPILTIDGVYPDCQARADAAGLITWEGNVGFTICRARQHAAGARRGGQARKEPPGGIRSEPDDHALGRSRGAVGWVPGEDNRSEGSGLAKRKTINRFWSILEVCRK